MREGRFHSWRRTIAVLSIGLCVPILGTAPRAGAAGHHGHLDHRRGARVGRARSTCFTTATTQLEMDQCAKKQLKAADRQLDAALRTEEKHYDKKLAEAAQRQWLAFRTAECTLEASPDKGGSIYPLTFAMCELHMAKSRLTQVEKVTATSPSSPKS